MLADSGLRTAVERLQMLDLTAMSVPATSRRGIDIRKHPAIHDHLKQFKKALTPGIPGGRKPGSYEWYEIQDNIAYWREFEQPKVIFGRFMDSILRGRSGNSLGSS